MLRFIWIGLAGVAGANLRYMVMLISENWWASFFPFDILIVNCLGAFFLGILSVVATRRVPADLMLAIRTGFIGSFTTFSAFSFDILQLLERGEFFLTGLYIIASIVLGLAFAIAGIRTGEVFQ